MIVALNNNNNKNVWFKNEQKQVLELDNMS